MREKNYRRIDFFYVDNRKQLEEKLEKENYLLLHTQNKEILCESLQMNVILPENLEDELKKYYKEDNKQFIEEKN